MIPVTIRRRRPAVRVADLRAAVAAVWAAEGEGEPGVELTVLDDAAIRAVNSEWLGHDFATDVIAFSYGGAPSPDGIAGEVLVSAETAAREAAARGLDPREELLLYVAHGCLHLLGWDDDSPARRRAMNARARAILRGAGLLAPRAVAARRSRGRAR